MEQAKDKFILLAHENEFKTDYVLYFFKTEEALKEQVGKLNELKCLTNQPMTEFSFIFRPNQMLPTDPEKFYRNRGDERRIYGGYFIAWRSKANKYKIVQRTYESKEDAEYRLQQLNEKGIKDILVLHIGEASKADYYYQKNIQKVWG